MTDEVVVRYRIIGPTGRLTHEAAVASCLPPDALYPRVIASGCWARDDWLVTERIPGEPLVVVWPRLSPEEREQAARHLAHALRALHHAPARHLRPPCLFGGAPLVDRSDFIDTLGDVAQRASGVASDTVAHVLDKLEEYRPAIDVDGHVMAHHDLHFGHGIWRDGRLVGLVDLEMSHANAADWDLRELLRGCVYWEAAASVAVDGQLGPGSFANFPIWFRDAYPAPFSHPAVVPRCASMNSSMAWQP